MKKGILILLGILLLLLGAAVWYFSADSKNPYDNTEINWGRFSGTTTKKMDKDHGKGYTRL